MTITTTLAASSAVGAAVTATTKPKPFKGLGGSVLILGLANVVRFSGLREVPALQPELHKEVKAMSIGQWCLAGHACVIAVRVPLTAARLQGPRLTHPVGREWHQRHPIEAHGQAVTLSDPLLRVDDKGQVLRLSPNQAANPVPVVIEREPAPPIPKVGHIP